MKLFATSLLALVISTTLMFAHGNATHIIGTVSAIDGNHVTVKTQEGKSEMVMVEKTTKYLNGSKPAALDALKVGTRVVIDAKMDAKTKMYSAEEVRIGVATPAKAESKAAPKGASDPHAAHK
jgi:hypothetical protein